MQSQIFRIVFEDPSLLVIEKLAPFISQRADRGEKEGLNEFIERTLKKKLYPVHRLDREVLGLMIFGLTRAAGEALSQQFKERKILKFYWARVWGKPREERATLVHFLKKNEKTNHVTVFPRETPGAKRAELSYALIGQNEETSDLLIHLKTGRSHQIRAQLAKIGHPICGDTRYSKREAGASAPHQIQLRSVYLGIHHPQSKTLMHWSLLSVIDPKNFFDV